MKTEMPVSVGISLAHASAQIIAADQRIDLLHIKGPAISSTLLTVPEMELEAGPEAGETTFRYSLDADVWVRPSSTVAFFDATSCHGWRMKVPFADGSSFEHAATLTHRSLAPLDVHRRFPGIGVDPGTAFERLWRDRTTTTIAGIECWVPSVTAQRLILLLNSARGGASHRDASTAWGTADPQQKLAIRDLALELDAEVALAAAIGEVYRYRDRPEHDLWQLLSSDTGTPLQLWWARVKAEGDRSGAIRRGFRLIFPSAYRMSLAAERELEGLELVRAYLMRLAPAVRSIVEALKRPFCGRQR